MRTGTSPRPQSETRGGAVRLLAEIPIRALSILAMIVLARRLGVEGFGAFAVMVGVAALIAEFADLGLSQILVRSVVSGGRAASDLVAAKVRLTVATLGGGSLGLVLWSAGGGSGAPVVALCTVHYVAFGWIEAVGAALRAHGRVWAEAGLLLLARATLMVLIGLTRFGSTPQLAAVAYALAVIPGLLVAARLGAPYLARQGEPVIAPILREALPLGLNGFLGRLTVRVEVFVLGALGMATGLGLFAAGLRIVESILTLPAAFAAGSLPALAREAAAGERRTGAAQRTMDLLAWGGLAAAVGLGLRAPEVLAILGASFVEAAPVLRIFAATLAICFLNTGLYYTLIATESARLTPRLTVVRVVIGFGIAVLLIPRFGAPGAAFGYLAAEVVLLWITTRVVTRHVAVSLPRPILRALVGVVPMAVALWFGPRPLIVAIPMAVAIHAVVTAIAFRRELHALKTGR